MCIVIFTTTWNNRLVLLNNIVVTKTIQNNIALVLVPNNVLKCSKCAKQTAMQRCYFDQLLLKMWCVSISARISLKEIIYISLNFSKCTYCPNLKVHSTAKG